MAISPKNYVWAKYIGRKKQITSCHRCSGFEFECRIHFILRFDREQLQKNATWRLGLKVIWQNDFCDRFVCHICINQTLTFTLKIACNTSIQVFRNMQFERNCIPTYLPLIHKTASLNPLSLTLTLTLTLLESFITIRKTRKAEKQISHQH